MTEEDKQIFDLNCVQSELNGELKIAAKEFQQEFLRLTTFTDRFPRLVAQAAVAEDKTKMIAHFKRFQELSREHIKMMRRLTSIVEAFRTDQETK